ENKEKEAAIVAARWEGRKSAAWRGRFDWLVLRPAGMADPTRGTRFELGFAIDSLAAVMFVMVTLVASLIHLFSIGYMSDELDPEVEDHQVPVHHHHAVGTEHVDPLHGHVEHFKRRGRFGRFFLYMS